MQFTGHMNRWRLSSFFPRMQPALPDSQVTVLLVDDEPLVADVLQQALEDGGYQVLTAVDGAEALQALESGSPAALVTDVHLGRGPSGWEVAERAREQKPTMAVVYATAAGGDEWASKGVPESLCLVKPFAPAQLVTAVSTLLNRTSNASDC